MPMKTPVVLTSDEARQHMERAAVLGKEILNFLFDQEIGKPYDDALACYLACSALCKQHNWRPQDFHQWVAAEFPLED